MANIYIIDTVRLNRNGLQAKDSNGTWVALHQQQGSLDGACVVYSTIMALLVIGYLDNEDIDIWGKRNPDKRTPKGKLLSHLLDEQGLVRDGYSLKTLTKELRELCAGTHIVHKTKSIKLSSIADSIYNDVPVILRLYSNNGMDHAVLAIGVEYSGEEENEKVNKILCLDPGFEQPTITYWNCVIDTERNNTGDFPYWYITDDIKAKIEIKEYVSIDNDK